MFGCYVHSLDSESNVGFCRDSDSRQKSQTPDVPLKKNFTRANLKFSFIVWFYFVVVAATSEVDAFALLPRCLSETFLVGLKSKCLNLRYASNVNCIQGLALFDSAANFETAPSFSVYTLMLPPNAARSEQRWSFIFIVYFKQAKGIRASIACNFPSSVSPRLTLHIALTTSMLFVHSEHRFELRKLELLFNCFHFSTFVDFLLHSLYCCKRVELELFSEA